MVIFLSYIERVTYWYIKRAVLGGLATLSEKRFVFFLSVSLLSIFGSTILTVLDLTTLPLFQFIINIETVAAVVFVIVGAVAFILKRTTIRITLAILLLSLLLLGLYIFQILSIPFQTFAFACFYGWILILNISTFSAVRNFIAGWSGRIVSFGKPKDAILFEWPIKIIAILSIAGFFILGFGFLIGYGSSDFISGISGIVAWSICVVMIFWWIKKSNNDVFASIVGLFFIFVVYHLALCIWNGIGAGTGSLAVDAIFIAVGTLYAVQGLCRRLAPTNEQKVGEEKSTWEDGSVIALLGTVLGYHAFIVNNITSGQSTRVLIYSFHQFSILFDAIILLGCVMLFATSLRFRNYVSRTPGPKSLVNDLVSFIKEKDLKHFLDDMLKKAKNDAEVKKEELVAALDQLKSRAKKKFNSFLKSEDKETNDS
ncbi:hypothetical protein [Candidatus Borrarchaeum sp.]|uniref:hypothetical protein n=1 Tax=Candidatus Borrarchaeum sp. TaxID=2846742 RepID=UPI00257CA4B2|nr:hypothetical protein [Candidatus Borrarchaeum sp.]